MKITACSIVKNEEQNIARSIESYKDAVDEIIIVDTGSLDNTVEICRAHGAKVLFYKWNNDFSAAKNFALEHANGDWIFFLDADEWFMPKLSRKTITDVLGQIDSFADGLMTKMCEYNVKTEKVCISIPAIRIFRNASDIKFQGCVHERIVRGYNEIKQAYCPDIEIYHSGYTSGLIEVKTRRNIDILYNMYNEGNKSAPMYFYLFRENYILDNFDEAVKFYKLFMDQEDADIAIKNNSAFVCIYEFMYRIMVQNPEKFNQNEIDNLLNQAYNQYPKLPIHSYMIGCEKMKANDYHASFDWFSKALKLNSQYAELFANSFLGFLNDTYYRLGYISQKLNNQDQAMTFYMEAVKTANDRELSITLAKLIEIIEAQPEEEIILFLNSLIDTKKEENIKAVLSALKYTRLHKAFVYYAIKYNREFDGQDETTYIAMILTGQAEMAVETAVQASVNPDRKAAAKECKNKVNYETIAEELPIDTKDNIGDQKWQLDYAAIAIMYSKSIDLYKRYKEYFSDEQTDIIEAYLEKRKIGKITEGLMQEHEKILNEILYIVEEKDLERFKEIIY